MRFFLDNYGCAKNQVDAEIIISNLIRAGYEQVDSAENADLIIINSCGFIESAKKESLDAVVAFRNVFPKKKIILAGCLAQRYAEFFKTGLPEVNGVFGNGDLNQIETLVKKVAAGKRTVLAPKQEGVCCAERTANLSYKNSAYVKITEGCSNHCSFCAIPLIRGELRSRPAADIVAEIKRLLKRGVFEINLIGQDVAAYGGELKVESGELRDSAKIVNWQLSTVNCQHSPLYRLLEKISALKGKFWIRLLYIHPDHFPPDVLELIERDRRILPYFDIPFQSGDDGIIRAMNRKKSAAEYVGIVQKIRAAFPAAAIRTTFLAGFPGESDAAFDNTLAFLKKIRADWAGCFSFSKEEGTAAAKMKNQVPKKIANGRKKILLEAQEKITAENLIRRVKNSKGENLEYEVLIEEVFNQLKVDSGGKMFAIGRAWFQAPDVDGNFVVQFDADDKKAAAAIREGAVVRARAVAVSGVDIDSVFVSG